MYTYIYIYIYIHDIISHIPYDICSMILYYKADAVNPQARNRQTRNL